MHRCLMYHVGRDVLQHLNAGPHSPKSPPGPAALASVKGDVEERTE